MFDRGLLSVIKIKQKNNPVTYKCIKTKPNLIHKIKAKTSYQGILA